MANPTTAKPTNPVLVNTASTVGQLMRCYCLFPTNGVMRDIVGNVMAQPWAGASCHGTGHAPATIANGYTQAGLTDSIARFGAGTTAIKWAGRGFAQAQAYPRTIFCEVKVSANINSSFARTVTMCGTGCTANAGYGLGYQVSLAGVITLGTMRQANFESASITLTTGLTYLIACTYVSSTSRLWQVYCRDTQAYITVQATGNQVTVPALSTPSSVDASVNDQTGWNGRDLAAAAMDVYVYGLHDDTFDPGTNSYFAALVTDPAVAARGTPATGGTLTASNLVNWDETTSAITILSGQPTGGTQGSLQYALHRSSSPWLAAPVSSATRVVGLQSSPLLVDTTAAPNTTYFYVTEQTDGTSTVYSTASSVVQVTCSGRLSLGDVFFCVMGDSRTSNLVGYYSAPQYFFSQGYRSGHVNRGYPGSCISIANNTLNWQPNTTQDPVNGVAGNHLLADMMGELQALGTNPLNGGVNLIVCDLGVNDRNVPNTTTVFGAKYQIILNYLISQGLSMLLHYPYPAGDVTSLSSLALVQQYQAVIDTLANGSTVQVVKPSSYEAFASGDIQRQASDGLHLADFQITGMAVARSMEKTLFPGSSGGGGSGGGNRRFGIGFGG